MIRQLLQHIGVGAAVALDAALQPTKVAEMREPISVRRVSEDGYEGVARALGGGFQPAGEVRENVWVHQTAQEGARSASEVFADEEAARATVPANEMVTRLAWQETMAQLRAAGELEYELQDMRPEAVAARYGMRDPETVGHTCAENPLAPCEGCLARNR